MTPASAGQTGQSPEPGPSTGRAAGKVPVAAGTSSAGDADRNRPGPEPKPHIPPPRRRPGTSELPVLTGNGGSAGRTGRTGRSRPEAASKAAAGRVCKSRAAAGPRQESTGGTSRGGKGLAQLAQPASTIRYHRMLSESSRSLAVKIPKAGGKRSLAATLFLPLSLTLSLLRSLVLLTYQSCASAARTATMGKFGKQEAGVVRARRH